MSNYGWIIDSSNDETGNSARIGTMGPRSIPPDIVAALQAYEGRKFRMRCDGETVPSFEGRYISKDRSAENYGFGPLDDLGAPDVGCTDIEFLDDDGGWNAL